MGSGQLDEIKALFDEASELDMGAQASFVESVRQRNPDLASELKELLTHSLPTSDTLSDAVSAVASDVGTDDRESRIGQHLGPYRLIEQIGQGGMGAVFRAERIDGEFEQQVAIKLIANHAFSPDSIERFRNERQILARLNHPNIASILDGGTSSSGTTYLVMELVEGLPVIEYCNAHNLSTRQRLQLFLEICDTLEFAHRNLVVHRDIKPSNILINTDGNPKLLDFGIAKLLDSGETSRPQDPATVIAMTPDYSSPEQILGLPVTTSCDVYSLGVLLFEVLTGERPYNRQGKRLSQIEDEILNTTPTKPSVALKRAIQSQGTHPGGARKLASDLDVITLAALRRKVEDRYQSVSALSADIRSYLNGQPISAKGRSFGYVARKFLSRNRWPTGIVAALLVTATGATAFHIDRIGAERDRVIHEAQKSAAVTKYLQNLFEINDPNQTQGKEITARDVLDRGTRRLEAELVDQPEIRARLLTSIGAVYSNLGLKKEGIETTRKAIEIQRSIDSSPLLLRSLSSLAQMLRLQGDFNLTRETLDEATQLAEQMANKDSEAYAWVHFEYGELHLIEGDYEQSLASFNRARDVLARLPDHDPEFDVHLFASMGQALQFGGDHTNAADHMSKALEMLAELDHDLPVERSVISHNLAVLLHELGRYEDAEPLYLVALEIDERVMGPEAPNLDIVATNVGRLYRDMGDFETSQIYLEKAVNIVRDIHGEEHFFTAYNSKNLADLLRDKQDYSTAQAMYTKVLSTYKATLEADSPYMASAMLAHAQLYVRTEQFDEAIKTSREALRICNLQLGETHWLTATTKNTLAEALIRTGVTTEAETLLVEAWDALFANRPEHDTTLAIANQLTILYRNTGNQEKSRYYAQQAEQLARQ